MRWDIIYNVALLSGGLCGSSAFMWPRRPHEASILNVGNLGWDNENFLESLGKGPDAIDQANAEYERLKRFGTGPPGSNDDDLPSTAAPGAELTKEQIERIKQNNEGETAGGGQMFKTLMERAAKGAGRPPQPTLQQKDISPEQGSGSGSSALPAGFENLSVEAQAALFRELMKNPQGALPLQQQEPSKIGQYSEKGLAPDGRRIGRNRDADAMVNTSDVYFAQLKQDSRIRNQARYVGDQEKAEAVFADPSLKEIKLHVNPYMEEQRQKEREMLETAPEEMILPEMYQEKWVDKKDAGISYKERLMSRRSGRTNAVVPPPAPSTVNPEAAAEPPPVQAPPVVQPPPEFKAVDISPPQTTQPSAAKTPEDTRKDMRTLMGLLLKHRGGPGFGGGRIKGAEMQKFEELAGSIMEMIQLEPVAPPAEFRAAPTKSSDVPVPSSVPANPAVASTAIETKPRVPAGDRINSMINCIDGAIIMYKNSPPELRVSFLATLRAAFLSAIATCNDLAGTDDATDYSKINASPSGTPAAERIDSMLACIDGAIRMFKNSPPELQGGVLLTLRAALMSAVGTCNALMAESELQAFRQQFGGTSAPPPPAQFTDAVFENPAVSNPDPRTALAEEQAPESAPAFSGNDENSALLEKIYNRLQAASGNGKMGLKPDMSVEEAEDLADSIAEMRALLVEELDTGIPRSNEQSPPASGLTASKYQEMLAKARAEKGGKQ